MDRSVTATKRGRDFLTSRTTDGRLSVNSHHPQLRDAVEYFWRSRRRYEGAESVAFAGRRQEVVGGRHFGDFLQRLRESLTSAGVPDVSIHFRRSRTYLPGQFRATKM